MNTTEISSLLQKINTASKNYNKMLDKYSLPHEDRNVEGSVCQIVMRMRDVNFNDLKRKLKYMETTVNVGNQLNACVEYEMMPEAYKRDLVTRTRFRYVWKTVKLTPSNFEDFIQ